MKRLALAVAVGSLTSAACMGVPKTEPLNPVRFLLIGDLVDTAQTAADSGDLARVATVHRRLADQGPVLFVSAGNVLAMRPGRARTNVDVLNAARLDYATLGRAELAMPADTLSTRIAASKFKWLSANCTFSGPGRVANLLHWDTVHVSSHKVGIFGLTRLPAGATSALTCSNPDSAAKLAIDSLANQGAELIVALTNQPTTQDRDLLLQQNQVDLVLGGGEREPQTAAIAERHMLKSGADARATQFVTLWGGKDRWRQAVGLVHIDERLPADTAVARAQKQIPAE